MLLNFIKNTAKMDEREMKIVFFLYLPQNIRIKEIKEAQPGVLEHFNQNKKKNVSSNNFLCIPL